MEGRRSVELEFEVAHDFRRVYGMVTQGTVLGISRGFTVVVVVVVVVAVVVGGLDAGGLDAGGLDALLRYDVAIRAKRRT